MKMCQPHWDKLRDAIRERGLYGEVAKSGAEAAQDMADGRPDPLMAGHMAIVANALSTVGLDLFTDNPDGTEKCPICFLMTHCKCGDPECPRRFERWIEHAADEQVALRTKGNA